MAGKKGMHKRISTSPSFAQAFKERLRADKIGEHLEKHALGEVEMTSTQVAAGLGLLKKVVPDVSAVEHSGNVTMTHEQQLDHLR
jgi:hypothetical protein